ncbi:MAG: hypothetical protein ACLGIF_02165, partial [Actinomycetes bacterium]
ADAFADEHEDGTTLTDPVGRAGPPSTSTEPKQSEPAAPKPDEADPPEAPPPAKGSKRKRAAVPSWDEIMFGGPKRPS